MSRAVIQAAAERGWQPAPVARAPRWCPRAVLRTLAVAVVAFLASLAADRAARPGLG